MQIAPPTPHSYSFNLIVRPNGIDAPWEVVDGYELDLVSLHPTYDDAVRSAREIAMRSNFRVGEHTSAGVRLLFAYGS